MKLPWRRRAAKDAPVTPPMDPALEALAEAVRERRPVLVYPCGCMPCPTHAAAQAARDKARDAWAAEWNQKLEQP